MTCELVSQKAHSGQIAALGALMTRGESDRAKKLVLESLDRTLRYAVSLHRDGRTVVVARMELRDGQPTDEEVAGFRSLQDFEDWAGTEGARFSQLLLIKQLREAIRGLFADLE